MALITGGNSGIGRATARVFAGRGVKVVLAARDVARGKETAHEIIAAGGDALFVRTDVAKAAEVAALVERTVEVYGRLDYAFNNAATIPKAFMPIEEFDEEEFDRVININLKGVWLCMKYEIRQMLRQQPVGGAIVNTSSTGGLAGAPTSAIYSASKGGVINLTKTAAVEHIQDNIRVNALVAGGFQTPMIDRTIDIYVTQMGVDRARLEERFFTQSSPMGRIGQPAEAAEAVVWLCSDAASFVTGHSLIVDGGKTASVL